jgi:hypothetical protein
LPTIACGWTYSYRNATIGSTEAARQAGKKHATAAAASNNNDTLSRSKHAQEPVRQFLAIAVGRR